MKLLKYMTYECGSFSFVPTEYEPKFRELSNLNRNDISVKIGHYYSGCYLIQ